MAKIVRIDNAMKLNGDFELSDLEIARLELKETQMKLSGCYVSPEDRPGVISPEDAKERLRRTLAGKKTREQGLPVDRIAEELEAIKLKLNEGPNTKKQALAILRETQRLLGRRRW